MKTIETLQHERNLLRDQLNTRQDIDNVVKELKKNEEEINKLKKIELLNKVNREQAKKRDTARLVWQCEQPTEDITTNDGSLHKIKAKKYPKLAAIPYVRLKYEDGHITEINTSGETFRMYSQKYEYNKPTEYTRPETFKQFLELNNIQAQEITIEKYEEFTGKLKAANEVMREAIKNYDKVRNQLDVYQMQYIGLVNQSNEHFYFYEAK